MVKDWTWRTPSNLANEEVSHILLIIKSATWLWYRMKYSLLSRNDFLIFGSDGIERAICVHRIVLRLNQLAEEIERPFTCVY